MSNQPKWKCIANLGDVGFLDYGGYFVFVDETGVYPPEAELLELDDPDNERSKYTIYRFVLEPCTYVNGVLSDNPFHPEHAAWFAKPESDKAERPQDTTYLSGVCSCMDVKAEELIEMFCSNDPIQRALAYRCIGDHHGWENLDSYPLTGMTRKEVNERYTNVPK